MLFTQRYRDRVNGNTLVNQDYLLTMLMSLCMRDMYDAGLRRNWIFNVVAGLTSAKWPKPVVPASVIVATKDTKQLSRLFLSQLRHNGGRWNGGWPSTVRVLRYSPTTLTVSSYGCTEFVGMC